MSIFLLLSPILILIATLYRKYTILCISLIAMLIGFTTSKFRTDLVNTYILDKKRYVKDIVATVKDINDRGSYKQILLYEIKNTKFKLDNIIISFRTKAEEDIKIGDEVKLSAKLFSSKIALSEYAYDFARIAYYQKINATSFAISKIAMFKKAETRKFQEYIESFCQYIYKNLQQNTKKPNTDIISALLIGKKDEIDQKTINVYEIQV